MLKTVSSVKVILSEYDHLCQQIQRIKDFVYYFVFLNKINLANVI